MKGHEGEEVEGPGREVGGRERRDGMEEVLGTHGGEDGVEVVGATVQKQNARDILVELSHCNLVALQSTRAPLADHSEGSLPEALNS